MGIGMALAACSVMFAGPGSAKAAEGNLEINETSFPDAVFCSYVSENYDKDHDGFLSREEIEAVTEMNLSEKDISSLEGIGYFTGLKMLDCKWTGLKNLDVSQNEALEILSFYENDAESLIVGNNPNLKILICGANCLTSLDVSGCPNLGILTCEWNEITGLDLSKNTALTILDCEKNKLTGLDLSNNTALTNLVCSWNDLTSLDLSHNTDLALLECVGNELTGLNLYYNEALTELNCSACGITALDASNLPKLSELKCSENKIAMLDVSNSPSLVTLDCHSNKLAELDVSDNTSLKKLQCQENEIKELDISENPELLNAIDVGDVTSDSKTIEYKTQGSEGEENILSIDRAVKIVGTEYIDIAGSTLSLPEYEYAFTGEDIEPEPTVMYEGNTLTNGTDYTLDYRSNYFAGTAAVLVKGIGKYRGINEIHFTIREEEKDLSKGTLTLSGSNFAYTGKAVTPEVTVEFDGEKLKENTDYTVTYTDNIKAGKATVTVTGIGDYSGTITKKFLIKQISFKYRAYVQKKGWMSWSNAKVSGSKASDMAGTTDNLRMETIQMQLSGVTGSIEYRAYCAKKGWTQWATTADTKTYAGTKGESRRVELIQLRAKGQVANLYDMYFRAYSEKLGWLNWAKSGEKAGTQGYAYKLEAFQVNFVKKGEAFKLASQNKMAKSFYDKTKDGADPK